MVHPGPPRSNSITSPLRLRWLWLCALAVAACLGATLVAAQDNSAQSGATPTLHVYTNLVQIPVLVLDAWRDKLSSPVAQNRFSISFDGGPWSRPTYARLEGDGPIDLSIVLDTRSAQSDLLEKMDQTIADLAPRFLHPGDHVSIYAIDCSSMDFVENVPAESVQLRAAVDTALSTWTARGHGKKAACNPETHLWDLLAFVTDKLSSRSGWRAVLAVTDGKDKNSKRSLADLTALAQSASVAIFGLRPSSDGSSGFQSGSARALSSKGSRSPNGGPLSNTALLSNDDLLSNACELTGGMMLDLNAGGVAKTMQRFTQMLRERYILEFPRPPNAQPGKLAMSVRIDKINAFIRVTGDGVPVVDQPLLADSSSIHPERSIAPAVEVGPADAAQVAEAHPEAMPAAPQQRPASFAAEPAATAPTTAPAVAQPPSTSMVTPPNPPDQTAPPPARTTPPPSSNVAFKVQVPLVVLDVVVADSSNHPVHGLTAADFTILDSGQKMTPQSFEEHASDEAALPAPPRKLNLGTHTFTNFSSTPNNGPLNILLLDALNTPMADQAYVRQQMLEYLKELPAGMRIAIFGLSSHLYMLQGFTSDPAVLRAALNANKSLAKDSPLLITPQEAEANQEEVDNMSGDLAAALLHQFLTETANFQDTLRVQYTLAAMDQIARYLSGMPGRKNLIWFSGSFPINIMPDGSFNTPSVFPGGVVVTPFDATADFSDDVKATAGLLAQAQVAVYPVDGRGLFGNPALNANVSHASMAHEMKSKPNPLAQSNIDFFALNQAEHSTMNQMADQTGGKAFYNTNGLVEAVQEAINDGSNYYTLTYMPANEKWDGSYRSVRVSLDKPSVHLFYRHGYFADNPANAAPGKKAPPVSAIDTAMLHGAAPSTQLLFNVRVTPSTAPAKPGDPLVIGTLDPTLKGKSLVRYDLLFALSGDQIALVDGPDGTRKASIQLFIAAYDAEGNELNYLGWSNKWTLKPEQVTQFTQQSLPVPMQFDLPSGKIFVRFGVLDAASQRIGTLEISETVAK